MNHLAYGAAMKQLARQFSEMLQPHISQKNISALSDVVGYLGAPTNLMRFAKEGRCMVELGKIVNALRHMYGL